MDDIFYNGRVNTTKKGKKGEEIDFEADMFNPSQKNIRESVNANLLLSWKLNGGRKGRMARNFSNINGIPPRNFGQIGRTSIDSSESYERAKTKRIRIRKRSKTVAYNAPKSKPFAFSTAYSKERERRMQAKGLNERMISGNKTDFKFLGAKLNTESIAYETEVDTKFGFNNKVFVKRKNNGDLCSVDPHILHDYLDTYQPGLPSTFAEWDEDESVSKNPFSHVVYNRAFFSLSSQKTKKSYPKSNQKTKEGNVKKKRRRRKDRYRDIYKTVNAVSLSCNYSSLINGNKKTVTTNIFFFTPK